MKEKVLKALSNVIDPDLKKDLVTLGMIRNLEVSGDQIKFDLVLTTPACPLKDLLKGNCLKEIEKVYPGANVEINMTSQVTTSKEDNSGILKDIKNIIAVSSGKGGVGKSTIAVNLAVGLAMEGASVGLLDADIHGPSVPTMLGLEGEKPQIYENGNKVVMEPMVKFGVKAISIGMLIDPGQPLVWRGPMLSSALKQLFFDTNWGKLDYLIIDLPPGTGDIHLSLAQQYPITGAIVVTTPQRVALADVKKSMEMFRNEQINIPLLGVVENMSYFTPKELPDNKYLIFGKGGGEELANIYQIPLLAQVPLELGLTDESDIGEPAILSDTSLVKEKLLEMTRRIAQQIAIINESVSQEV